jgi:hypothetical protein
LGARSAVIQSSSGRLDVLFDASLGDHPLIPDQDHVGEIEAPLELVDPGSPE